MEESTPVRCEDWKSKSAIKLLINHLCVYLGYNLSPFFSRWNFHFFYAPDSDSIFDLIFKNLIN